MFKLVHVIALDYVAQDDAVSLRMICTATRNRQCMIEELDQYGNTALLKACHLGRFDCARILLDFGASIFAINYCGQNALTLATYAGSLRLVLELLRHRSYQDFNKSSLMPAICVAAMRQHKAIEDHFLRLDPSGVENIQTVHGMLQLNYQFYMHALIFNLYSTLGLCVNDLRQMVNVRFKKSLNNY